MSACSADIAALGAAEVAELIALRKENAALRAALPRGEGSLALGSSNGALAETLDAMMTVLDAQREQIDKLQSMLTQKDDEIETLKADLQAAMDSRKGIEDKLRVTASGFGKKIAQMEAKVLEAEKDVVLGGHVLIAPRPFATEKDQTYAGPPKLPRSPQDDDHLWRPRIVRPQASTAASRSCSASHRRSSPSRRLEPLDPDGVRDAPSSAGARLEFSGGTS